MQIIILLLQEITSRHGGGFLGVGWGHQDDWTTRDNTPPPPSQHQPVKRPSTIPVLQCDKSDPESVILTALHQWALAGLIWKEHRGGRVRRHWRPHGEDRSLLLCLSKTSLRSSAALLHLITLFMPAEDFFFNWECVCGGGWSLARDKILLKRNPGLHFF